MRISEVRAVQVRLPPAALVIPPRLSWAATTPRGLPLTRYPEFLPSPERSPGLSRRSVWVHVTAEDGTEGWPLQFRHAGGGAGGRALYAASRGPDCFATELLNDLM